MPIINIGYKVVCGAASIAYLLSTTVRVGKGIKHALSKKDKKD